MRQILILAIIAATTLALHAQQQLLRQVYDTKSNTYVQVTSMFGKLPNYGYAPIRIELNNGTTETLEYILSFTSNTGASFQSGSGSRMTSDFFYSCAPGSKETYDLMVPLSTVFETSSYNCETSLKLSLICPGYDPADGEISDDIDDSWPSVLVSKALYTPNASSLSSKITTSHSKSRGTSVEFGGDFEPKSMPTDWRAYLAQDVIMMTSNDWKDLAPGASTAILEWNRLGGRLIIYASHPSTTLTTLGIAAPDSDSDAKSIQRSLGEVTLLNLPTANRLKPKKTIAMIKKFNGKPYKSTYQSLLTDYSAGWPLEITLGEKNFNTAFFILILVAFGILVGPINLFVFAKAGKRHKLFITTPLISLGASLLLTVIILFQDGFGGRGHRLVLMEICPSENNAYITQEQAARTGVLLSSSFETSEPALITPVALKKSRWSRVVVDGESASRYIANHGDHGLAVSGDWFQSRSIHGHLLKTIRPTRGRIEISASAGPPKLTSSFDFDLGTLFYQSDDLSWWKTDALSKGNTATLSPSNEKEFKTWLKTQSDRFSQLNAQQLNRQTSAPGHFYTITEHAPAIDTYGSIKWLTTTTVITGPVVK